MIEDLYTGKTTIRQIRQSHVPEFHMKEVWEKVLSVGGPGIVTNKNYLVCPSSALLNAMLSIYSQALHEVGGIQSTIGAMNEYCRRYPLTMLIQD